MTGTQYGVREQFPAEIENTRKLLYPVMKKAKKIEGNKVRRVRDKLYINDIQYIPSTTETQNDQGARPKTYNQNPKNRDNQRGTDRHPYRNAWGINNTRTFYAASRQPAYSPFNIGTSNRFRGLAHPATETFSETPLAANRGQTRRKQPASSPIENDNTKKVCGDNEYVLPDPPNSPSAAPIVQMDTHSPHPSPPGSPSVPQREPTDTQSLPDSEQQSENPKAQINEATETGSISLTTDTDSNNAAHEPLKAQDISPSDASTNDSDL